MQQQRRTNPYPFTWELPTLALVAALLVAVLGVHTGRGLATLVAGHGWTWPQPSQLFRSLPALLAGDPGAGLPADTLTPSAGAPLLAAIVVAEAILFTAVIVALRPLLNRWGPQRMRGMATAGQAEAVLGVRRLHQVRHIVRPDLYPRKQPS